MVDRDVVGTGALRMPALSSKLPAKISRTDRRVLSRRFQPDGRSVSPERQPPSALALKCRRKFLRYYPGGFVDADYLDLERGYKWTAHERWSRDLGEETFKGLLQAREFGEIAARAVGIEARTNLLFSFEKMALRDAVKGAGGAKSFAEGLFEFLHSDAALKDRFTKWTGTVAGLPRRQTRVLTWPVVTVFGFIAQPRTHFFLKPMVTRKAAERYGYDLGYTSKPQWDTYAGLLRFARCVREDLGDLRPRDMIDIQSFLWVLGSDEYPG
jgi:hypothetical protein